MQQRLREGDNLRAWASIRTGLLMPAAKDAREGDQAQFGSGPFRIADATAGLRIQFGARRKFQVLISIRLLNRANCRGPSSVENGRIR